MTETPVAVDTGRFSDDPRRSFTLPSAVYTDPAVLELERDRIFWRSWILVAHESDVAETGAYVTVDLLGQPIFLIRSDDDELRGFYNVCQHRGHLLLEGRGVVGKRITCPYHAWAYDSSGALKGARMSDRMEGFDHAEFTLPSVRVETMAGFVFVNLDDDARPMDEVYPGLADELDRLAFHDGPLAAVDTATFDIAGNWKNVADNLLECYHCHPAHPGFVDLIDMDGYRNDCHENWSVQSGPLRPGTEVYETDEGAQTFASVFIWPNVSIGHIPGQRGRLIFQFFPTGAETTEQRLTYYGPHGERTPKEDTGTEWFNTVLGPEDVDLVESVQRGLRSKGYDQGRFICIPDRPELSEHAVHHFHTMVMAALDDRAG